LGESAAFFRAFNTLPDMQETIVPKRQFRLITTGFAVNKQSLIDAIRKSGGSQSALDEVDDMWVRVDYLQKTGRYGALLSQISNANNKSNLLALTLELNLAYQFESLGLELTYEVSQNAQKNSTIDFLRVSPGGEEIFIELRLMQQPQHIAESISGQIENTERYTIALDAEDDRDAVVRIKSNVLSKVQDKKGNPIKFFSIAKNAINIVAVDIADCMLGMMDIHDCMLACHGDTGVEEPYRRGVFGLFQPDMPHFPQNIHDLAKTYAHIRGTIHGILFLDRVGVKILTYRLCHYLVWNPALIDEPTARCILADVSTAIPAHPSLSNYEYE
jgi:hypothetical protein